MELPFGTLLKLSFCKKTGVLKLKAIKNVTKREKSKVFSFNGFILCIQCIYFRTLHQLRKHEKNVSISSDCSLPFKAPGTAGGQMDKPTYSYKIVCGPDRSSFGRKQPYIIMYLVAVIWLRSHYSPRALKMLDVSACSISTSGCLLLSFLTPFLFQSPKKVLQ